MKIAAVILVAGVLATGAARAADAGEELLKKSGCTACHAVDKKVVGPSYKEVAAKYRGDAKAPALLFEKVKKGGSGVWGPVPMPPNASVSDVTLAACSHSVGHRPDDRDHFVSRHVASTWLHRSPGALLELLRSNHSSHLRASCGPESEPFHACSR